MDKGHLKGDTATEEGTGAIEKLKVVVLEIASFCGAKCECHAFLGVARLSARSRILNSFASLTPTLNQNFGIGFASVLVQRSPCSA